MGNEPSDCVSVEVLAEDFLNRLRRGEKPSINEYQEKHPEFADEILEFFPTLMLVETLSSEAASGEAEFQRAVEPRPIERLGDYEILREIGRGGMGVVYEAKQQSLGRTVAVKVLPPQYLSDDARKARFLQEAKATAKLHHTNIVPIFGIGEQDGMNYFVMQYIPGVGLDEIMSSLARIRRRSSSKDSLARVNFNAVTLACSVLHRGATTTRLNTDEQVECISGAHGHDESYCRDECRDPGFLGRDPAFCQNIETALSGQARSRRTYFHVVAKIGIQVARALQYAHDQGIVHRDIKPANLLMDPQGTVWVTDFGLAKLAEADGLTRTGDFVGTLRYMAPEQIDSHSDERSDIYSLGLTLYEMLAFRPAFDAVLRSRLIKQVTTTTPIDLKRLDPDIPGDLRTIVHKSIEREPGSRYQTAGDMAEDLERFLADLPIRARRHSLPIRLSRWARRKPAAATLAFVFMAIAIVSPLLAVYFARLSVEATESQRQARLALYDSRRSEATASRFSGRPGQQFNTLRAIADAVDLHRELGLNDHETVARMRADAIASLALPDFLAEKQWPVADSSRQSAIDFDADLKHFTSVDRDDLLVRRTDSGQTIARITVGSSCERVRFSPDGRLLSVTNLSQSGNRVTVWDWRREELIYRIEKPATLFASDFSPDSHFLAVGHDDSTVTLHDLQRGEEVDQFEVASSPITLAFHPREPKLAVNCQTAYHTELWDLREVKRLRTFKHPSDVFSLCWSPTGRFLAVVEGFEIYLWDTESQREEPLQILRGHTWVVAEIRFHPSGRFLVSHSWREGKTRLWDPFRARQLLISNGLHTRFDGEGRRLAFRGIDHVGIWTVSTGEALIDPTTYSALRHHAIFCDYCPDGKLLAAGGDHGVALWDPKSWTLRGKLPVERVLSVRFEGDCQHLLVGHDEGLTRFRLEWQNSNVEAIAVESIELPEGYFPHYLSQSMDGRIVTASLLKPPDLTSAAQLMVLDGDRSIPRLLPGYAGLRFTSVSPDGKWVATGNWNAQGACVWDVHDGRAVRQIDTSGGCVVAFSPDGKQLVTADVESLCFWEVGTWELLRRQPRASLVGALAFSPDGRILASSGNEASVELIDPETGTSLATLATNAEPTYVSWMRFSPDGTQLAVCLLSEGVRIWDLGFLRKELRSINLDWK